MAYDMDVFGTSRDEEYLLMAFIKYRRGRTSRKKLSMNTTLLEWRFNELRDIFRDGCVFAAALEHIHFSMSFECDPGKLWNIFWFAGAEYFYSNTLND